MAKDKKTQVSAPKVKTVGTRTPAVLNTTPRTKKLVIQPPVMVGHTYFAPRKVARARRRLEAGITGNMFTVPDSVVNDCRKYDLPVPNRRTFERTVEYIEKRKREHAQVLEMSGRGISAPAAFAIIRAAVAADRAATSPLTGYPAN